MKKSAIILITVISIFQFNVSARDGINRNTILTEIGGNGTLGAIKYERIIFEKDKIKLAVGAGVGLSIDPWYYLPWGLSIPVEGSFLYGNRHYFESGLGYASHFVLQANSDEGGMDYDGHHGTVQYKVGYRFQQNKGQGGFSAKVAANVVTAINLDGENGYEIFPLPVIPTVAFGYSF